VRCALAVSNETIMNKMMAELQQARAAADDQNKWEIHIAHIQLLSELLLDDHKGTPAKVERESVQPVQPVGVQQQHEDTSIFDF